MILTFRAQKMIERIYEEGKQDMLDFLTVSTIWAMDGEPANTYNWLNVAGGEPVALISATDDHPKMYVNIADCD